ncbi:MAG TPA: MarR family transcriptional regulator [Polyangia bacterium]|nr:MarR family transcriptional regulator [Polyangia bacterium]
MQTGPRLDEQLCFPLYAAARLVVQAYAPLLQKLGLTYPQYLVLMVLWENDGATVNEIGARLYLDSGTLTPLLRRLDEAGLIRRTAKQSDQRAVENWLTRAGRALERRSQPIPRELFCRLELPVAAFVRLRGDVRALLGRLTRMIGDDQK